MEYNLSNKMYLFITDSLVWNTFKVKIWSPTVTMSNMSMSGPGQMNHVTYGQGYAPIGEVRELGDHKQAGVSTVSNFG